MLTVKLGGNTALSVQIADSLVTYRCVNVHILLVWHPNISHHFSYLSSIGRCVLLAGPLHDFSTALQKCSSSHLRESSLTEFPLGPLVQASGKAAYFQWCVFTKYKSIDESDFSGYITFSYSWTPLLNR